MANFQEVVHVHEVDRKAAKKEVIRVTIILSAITLVELALGYWLIFLKGDTARHMVKGAIWIFMLAKAFYIVAYFMHLKHELRNMIMTIVVPLLLFVWFIIAFLADGHSYKNLRNKYDPYFLEQSKIKVEPKPHGTHGGHDKDAKQEGEME